MARIRHSAEQIINKRREARTAETVAHAQAAEAEAGSLESQIGVLSAAVGGHRAQLIAVFMPPGADMTLAGRVISSDQAASALPAEYRVLDLSDDDAKALGTALAAERRALARGEPVPTNAQQRINQYRNLHAVAAARNHMTVWMPSVEQLFFVWQ